ncbi:MAG: hypothetical protein Ct9H90mP11_07070 [Acidimicrobiales bacterium]|nr:MAG: hypothetical protein Ct9H90mP11_07070 [Acidimicrobiales bacterium]
MTLSLSLIEFAESDEKDPHSLQLGEKGLSVADPASLLFKVLASQQKQEVAVRRFLSEQRSSLSSGQSGC